MLLLTYHVVICYRNRCFNIHKQCATGNPVPVDPVIFFRSGSGPVPVQFRPNTDQIDRIWLSLVKKYFLKFGCSI